MAMLKSWYAMLFLFLTQFLYGSYGNERENIEQNCVENVLRLQLLATGYDHHQYDRQSLEKISPGDLRQIIADLYNELECGYFYSAQLHLKLTGDAVFNNGKNVLTSETIEDFSFYKEATLMINSLMDPKHDRVNDLWTLFVYAREISVFFKKYVNGGGALNTKILNETQRIHDYVLSVINGRVERCASDNYFNMKSQKHFTAQSSRANNDCVMNSIRRNKRLLDKNFKKNRANQLLQFSMAESFSYGLLLFRDEKTFNLFFDEFLAANSDRIDLRFAEIESGLSIKSFGEYLQQVIDMFKIIVLQITLSYATRLAGIANSNDVLARANEFNDEILAKFIVLMRLNDDTEFKSVYKEFVCCYITGEYSNELRFKQCKSELNVSIDFLIWSIRRKNNLPRKIISKVANSDQSLSDILKVGKRFVVQIQNDIGEHSIRLVQSFLKMIDENYTFFLRRR